MRVAIATALLTLAACSPSGPDPTPAPPPARGDKPAAHVETVRILLAAGVPVNHVNDLQWTALLEAIVLGNGSDDHVRVVRILLDAGADPPIRDGNGVLLRQLASDRGFQRIVDVIDRHADR